MFQFAIQNFQSIHNASILVQGLTAIRGESNEGKSAVVRALAASCFNRFRSGQVTYGADSAKVAIRVPDSPDTLQVLKPSDGSVRMKLGTNVYSKLSRTTPPEVQDFLRFGKIDDYSLNFHPQFQSPILQGFSQQRVMQILSTSTALDDLNACHQAMLDRRSEVKGSLRSAQSFLSRSQQGLDSTVAKLSELEPLIIRLKVLLVKKAQLLRSQQLLSACPDYPLSFERIPLLERIITLCSNSGDLLRRHSLLSSYPDTPTAFSRIPLLQKVLSNASSLQSKYLLRSKLLSLPQPLESPKEPILRYIILTANSALSEQSSLTKLCSLSDLDDSLSRINQRSSELTLITEKHICPICNSHFIL